MVVWLHLCLRRGVSIPSASNDAAIWGDAHAFEVVAVDAAYCFGLFGVNDGLAAWAAVVAEEVLEWHIYFPVGKAFALTPRDVLGDRSGFFLGKA